MKLQHLIPAAVAAAALSLSSCNPTGTSEATPRIGVAAINLATQDTLGFTGNRLDTVCVGDTIQFQSIVNGIYNGLLEYHIVSSDTAHVEFLWGSENKLDSIFNSHEGGSFYMDGQYSQLFFPFKSPAGEQFAARLSGIHLHETTSRSFPMISTSSARDVRRPILFRISSEACWMGRSM